MGRELWGVSWCDSTMLLGAMLMMYDYVYDWIIVWLCMSLDTVCMLVILSYSVDAVCYRDVVVHMTGWSVDGVK